MYVELSSDRIWCWVEFRENELIQKVPGAKWNQEHSLWHLPLSWAGCQQLRGVFGTALQIGPELAAWAAQDLQARVGPCLSLRDAEDAEMPASLLPKDLPKAGDIRDGEVVEQDWDLEPRQRAGVRFLATAHRAALCDGMGSGKTVQTICALRLLEIEGQNPFPAVVVCPNSMKATWAKEWALWDPRRKVQVVSGSATQRRKQIESGADVLVFNWEGLRYHSRVAGYGSIRLTDKEKEDGDLQAIALRTLVADEAHRAKNPSAKQTRAAWQVAKQCMFRFALTGTPVANSPEDTWAIMHMVEPDEWPSKGQFLDRYALQSWSQFGFMNVVGIRGDVRDEFFRILDPRFIRRPTEIVVPDLKAKLPPQVREVDLLPKQRKAYDQLKKELLAELESGVLMATNPLTRMTRLVQLAASYGELDEHGNLTLTEPSSKLDALMDILEEIGDEESAVVFAESRQLIELAAARCTKSKILHGLITGAIDVHRRQAAVDDFQAGRIRVILATLGAGGEGLTLTAARHSIFLQRSFSLVKNLQAEDRIWRKGQMREVQRIDIMAADTIEQHVFDIGLEKQARLEEICRDEETLRRWLDG
jgi:SNF2 family DNA or RNA helicase